MKETALHHLIFRIITIILIIATLITNTFSDTIAYFSLLSAALVCVIWLSVNTSLLCIRMGKKDFNIHDGLGFEPIFFLIPITLILAYMQMT